jgi:hypothetical protein
VLSNCGEYGLIGRWHCSTPRPRPCVPCFRHSFPLRVCPLPTGGTQITRTGDTYHCVVFVYTRASGMHMPTPTTRHSPFRALPSAPRATVRCRSPHSRCMRSDPILSPLSAPLQRRFVLHLPVPDDIAVGAVSDVAGTSTRQESSTTDSR